jgi:Ca2+:H+ antiporter
VRKAFSRSEQSLLTIPLIEWLVDSINGLTATGAISEQWVGLILLPIVGNAAEHVTGEQCSSLCVQFSSTEYASAVTVSYKDKLDLSIGVAVGSSIQIALFVIPVLVLLGWALDKPLSLLFDPFESVTLFLAVLLAQSTMADARSNWLEGYLLMMVYVIIAVSFYFYPSEQTAEARLLVCG